VGGWAVVFVGEGGWASCWGGVGVVVWSGALETPLKIPRERDSFLASREEEGGKSSPNAANARRRNSSAPRWTYPSESPFIMRINERSMRNQREFKHGITMDSGKWELQASKQVA
jgi:hypothetical protein